MNNLYAIELGNEPVSQRLPVPIRNNTDALLQDSKAIPLSSNSSPAH